VTPRNGEQWPLAALLPRARKKVFRLWAPDTSYDVKGQLRDRGWRWHSGSPKRPKSWYFDGETEIAAQEEKAWVEANGYIGRPPRTSIELLTGKERYSERAE
jgi:DNA polymerase-3 subunit epsilon